MPAPATILIVDDNETNRMVLRAQLESMKHQVCEAIDGQDALDVLGQRKVDAVISDILMPRMDGYRLCQEIRRRENLRTLPIVVYTGTYLAPEDEKLALRSGANIYLMKPAPLADLRRVVAQALSLEPAAPAETAPPDAGVVMREYNAVLINKLEEKSRELEAKNAQLERDITERQRAEEALRLVSEQTRALALRLEHIREQERTRIAREIHDVLAQELTRLKIDLVWLARRTTKPIDDPVRTQMSSRISDALAQTDVAITTVQRIATELRPVILDSLGLSAAVEWQAEDFSRRTGIACHARTPGPALTLDRERATALFRILQESLTNIARHAFASQVDIQLSAMEDHVTLVVRDNGHGIAAAQLADPLSIGLTGMRERAQAFGGTAEIAPAGAGGTVVAVRLPLNPPAGAPTSA
jgi:signal transduction histidine kinase